MCNPLRRSFKNKLLNKIDTEWQTRWEELMHEKTWTGIYNHIKTHDPGDTHNNWQTFREKVPHTILLGNNV